MSNHPAICKLQLTAHAVSVIQGATLYRTLEHYVYMQHCLEGRNISNRLRSYCNLNYSKFLSMPQKDWGGVVKKFDSFVRNFRRTISTTDFKNSRAPALKRIRALCSLLFHFTAPASLCFPFSTPQPTCLNGKLRTCEVVFKSGKDVINV